MVRSCLKPADGRVMQNCLRFAWGRKAVRLAFEKSQETKKIRQSKARAKM